MFCSYTGMREYCERMIHFWREVSLAGMPRAGRAMDECYALLFESALNCLYLAVSDISSSVDSSSNSFWFGYLNLSAGGTFFN